MQILLWLDFFAIFTRMSTYPFAPTRWQHYRRYWMFECCAVPHTQEEYCILFGHLFPLLSLHKEEQKLEPSCAQEEKGVGEGTIDCALINTFGVIKKTHYFSVTEVIWSMPIWYWREGKESSGVRHETNVLKMNIRYIFGQPNPYGLLCELTWIRMDHHNLLK